MKHEMNSFKSILVGALALGALGLSSCGIKGELKTPPPVWGDTQPDSPDTPPT